MKVEVSAKTHAKLEKVEYSEGHFKVWTKEPPVDGSAIIKLLAEYFKVPRSRIRLISGASGKKKWFEINEMIL